MSAWLYYSCLAALVICNLIIGYAWRMRHEDLNEAANTAMIREALESIRLASDQSEVIQEDDPFAWPPSFPPDRSVSK
tara:strand:- start:1119 stop:1352 length:234 start_codon:yes stop_codon:yes gene_type:complete